MSAALWALLGLLARGSWLRAGLALFAAWVAVIQIAYYRFYHSFVDDEATLCARSMWADVKPVVAAGLPAVALAACLIALIDYALLTAAPAPRRRVLFSLGLAVLIALPLGPSASQLPPDLRALWSLRVLLRPKVAKADVSIRVAPLRSRREQLPNVLFILTESVRASDYRSRGNSPTFSRTAALVPNRIELRQMRSVGSYTAVAVNALLEGRVPLGAPRDIAETPMLFDFLRSTRLGGVSPRVLYWSAQGDSFFARANLANAVDSLALDADLVGRPVQDLEETINLGVDKLLAAKVGRDLDRMQRPFFLLVHLVGTHAPYFVDDSLAPFRPYAHAVTWSGLNQLHNAYLNAMVAQDQSVARVIMTFLRVVGEEPYLIFFTSDHGESFGEHQAIHHGQNLYDEQIHVPAWVNFGNGALDASEEQALRAHASDFVTHLDLLPTLLDAYGVLDSMGMLQNRRRLQGRSLLRPFTEPQSPIPITSCTPLFQCPLLSYGMLQGDRALVAQPWDDTWRCIRLTDDIPQPFADPKCALLRAASRQEWRTLPNGRANR